ncbi:MAG: TraB/GumN family protein [Altererythrobacter sp.]|nr:TraB/GumN family protein [Altererythrobacter sp.]
MITRFVLLLAGALALASCNPGDDPDESSKPSPSPILYEITDAEGEAQGWLFGTIHALPDGVEWRTPEIERVIDQAQLLVVEVGDLADTRSISSTFSVFATTPDQPDIRTRVRAEDRLYLDEMMTKGHFSSRDFGNIETWAAALMLAQVSSTGSPRNGVDKALLLEFPDHRVRELEGTLTQLRIFDDLAPQDQTDLLTGILAEYRSLGDNPERLRLAWLSGDEEGLITATQSGIMADPELYDALLAGRNRAWMNEIDRLLADGPNPLIAVGAAHLVGPDGLATLIGQRGYTLSRLQ